MESHFCITALQHALRKGNPTIFNTDQGSQFTSAALTGVLLDKDIAISTDGRGRALDTRCIKALAGTSTTKQQGKEAFLTGQADTI